jgi:hypothetical protein
LEWAVLVWAGLAVACVEPPPGSTAEQEALDACALANDGDLCDDHQACTYPDACLNKKCVGMPVLDGTHCTDGNVCTINDHCAAGVCVGTIEADGTTCTDGDPCTDPDVCMQGVCLSGGPLVCDDGNACTIDSCEPGVGCVFSQRDCGLPPDAGSDALMTPDAPRFDSGADALVDLGGDAIVADGPMSDAPPFDTGVDLAAPDARVDAGPPGPDAAIDGGPGGDAAGSDALLDAGGDLMETPPELRARGGGCACAVGTGGAGGWGTLAFVVGVIGVGAGRRGRGRRRGRG